MRWRRSVIVSILEEVRAERDLKKRIRLTRLKMAADVLNDIENDIINESYNNLRQSQKQHFDSAENSRNKDI